jgi:hypothetical protein
MFAHRYSQIIPDGFKTTLQILEVVFEVAEHE